MARILNLILLLGVFAMSVNSTPNGQRGEGEFLNKLRQNEKASHLPDKHKIDMKREVTEEYGMQYYPCHLEEQVPPPRISSYELVPGIGYYKFYPEGAMSYYQALSTCKNDGGHLAIINSEPEMLALKNIYKKYGDADDLAWLGFNDIAKEGKFETIFGQPLEATGYAKWDIDQPESEEKGEDCGAMDREGKLHDLYCEEDAPWPFFCEYELDQDQWLAK